MSKSKSKHDQLVQQQHQRPDFHHLNMDKEEEFEDLICKKEINLIYKLQVQLIYEDKKKNSTLSHYHSSPIFKI